MIGDVGSASETVTVEFPIAKIFDFLADGSNNVLWRPEVVSVIFAAGPPDKAVWAQTVRSANGRTHKADYRISWYEHPGTLELTVFNGPSRPTTMFQLRSLTGGATQVTCTVDLKPLFYPLERTRFGTRAARALASEILNLGAGLAKRG